MSLTDDKRKITGTCFALININNIELFGVVKNNLEATGHEAFPALLPRWIAKAKRLFAFICIVCIFIGRRAFFINCRRT